MPVRVTVKKLGLTRRPNYRAALARVAAEWVTEIRARTQSGHGIDGRFFAGYAPSSRARGKTGHVSLTETGAMLGAMAVLKTSRNAVELGFRSGKAAEIAGYHMRGTSRMPQREFFGLSKAQIQRGIEGVIAALT